ncbi:MAG: YibE/F family protein [Candidatus Obscuribacterales bacterium]|nr:YibE/F family protein [Candidatus Obscuribacterales bacterium]
MANLKSFFQVIVVATMLMVISLLPAFAIDELKEDFVAGKVLKISQPSINQALQQSTGIVSGQQLVEVNILEGTLKGATVTVTNEVTDNPAYNINIKPGQELILSVITDKNGHSEVNISDYHRAPILGWLFAAFLTVFLIFGGKKGIKSLAGLVICVALIAFVLLPLSLQGGNPLLIATGICLVATASSMLLVAGFSKKAYAAILGTIGGVIVAGLISYVVIITAPLTGLTSEEAQILRATLAGVPLKFYSGLLAAGMLIGALGVIMDVAISIASSVAEVSSTDKTLTVADLYKSGMNVGRDIMGTMTNTLVLAYAGSALPLLLLVAQMPSIKLLNLDLLATEIAAALSGSIGLVLTIPLTALISARLMSHSKDSADMKSFNASKTNSDPGVKL